MTRNFEDIKRSLEKKIAIINSYEGSSYRKAPTRQDNTSSTKLSSLRTQEQDKRTNFNDYLANRSSVAARPVNSSLNRSNQASSARPNNLVNLRNANKPNSNILDREARPVDRNAYKPLDKQVRPIEREGYRSTNSSFTPKNNLTNPSASRLSQPRALDSRSNPRNVDLQGLNRGLKDIPKDSPSRNNNNFLPRNRPSDSYRGDSLKPNLSQRSPVLNNLASKDLDDKFRKSSQNDRTTRPNLAESRSNNNLNSAPLFGRKAREGVENSRESFNNPLQGRKYSPLEFNKFEREGQSYEKPENTNLDKYKKAEDRKPRDFATFLREELGDGNYKPKVSPTVGSNLEDRVKGPKPRDFATFLKDELDDNSYTPVVNPQNNMQQSVPKEFNAPLNTDTADEPSYYPTNMRRPYADSYPNSFDNNRSRDNAPSTNNDNLISKLLDDARHKNIDANHREVLRNIDLNKDFVLQDSLNKKENTELLFNKLKDDVLNNLQNTYLKIIANLKDEILKLKDVPYASQYTPQYTPQYASQQAYQPQPNNFNNLNGSLELQANLERLIFKIRDDLVSKIEKEKNDVYYIIKNIKYLNHNIKDLKENLFKYADESYKKTLQTFQNDLQLLQKELITNNNINNNNFADLHQSLVNKTQQIFTTLSNNIIEELKHIRQDILAINTDGLEETIGDYIEELRYDVLRKLSKNHISLSDKVDKIAEKFDTKAVAIESKETKALDDLTAKIHDLSKDLLEKNKVNTSTLESNNNLNNNYLLNLLTKQIESNNNNNKIQEVINKLDVSLQNNNRNSNDFEKTVLNTLLSKALDNKQDNNYLKDFLNYKLVKEITKEEKEYKEDRRVVYKNNLSDSIYIEQSMKNLEDILTLKIKEVKDDLSKTILNVVDAKTVNTQQLYEANAVSTKKIIDEINQSNNNVVDKISYALKDQYNNFINKIQLDIKQDNKEIDDHLFSIANKVDYLINFTKTNTQEHYNESIFNLIDDVSVNLKEIANQKKEITNILQKLNNDLSNFDFQNIDLSKDEELKYKISLLENIQKTFTVNYVAVNNDLLNNIVKIEDKISKILTSKNDKNTNDIVHYATDSLDLTKDTKSKNIDIMANMSYINKQISKKI